jgi:hypothetical protein
MTCYIARYGKKRDRLAEHEAQFVAALDAATTGKALEQAVETVRLAQIRALKEKRAKFAPSEKNVSVLETIDRDIRWWSVAPQHAIVEGYHDVKRRRSMSSAVRRATR